VPFAANPVRQRNAFRTPSAHARWVWIVALIGAAMALGGCLQDAQNQASGFNFDNPADPTATASTSIAIVSVDYLSSVQTVTIVNSSGLAQDMTNWLLQNSGASGNQYRFSSFTLGVGTFVRVHGVTGTDTGTDLYAGTPGTTSPFPYSPPEVAILQNSGGVNVSSCTVGSPTC